MLAFEMFCDTCCIRSLLLGALVECTASFDALSFEEYSLRNRLIDGTGISSISRDLSDLLTLL